MLVDAPTREELTGLIGEELCDIWQRLCAVIEQSYDMERLWSSGGKKWIYEYKYRRGGKSLCALYAKAGCLGFMVIFGRDEREKVENIRHSLSPSVCQAYDAAETYHDGKWVMFLPTDASEFDDYMKLLAVKRKPNRTR